MTGAMIGLIGSAGLLLVVSGWARTRRPALDQRVLPYVRDVHPYASVGPSTSVVGAVFGPTVQRAGSMLGDVLGGSASVTRRLVRLGSPMSIEDFRIRQMTWGGLGLALGTAVSALLWSTRGAAVPWLVFICIVGMVVGVLWCDNNLSSQVRTREKQLQAEFPVVADLLALAVAAGESPIAGLERIIRVCTGTLSHELGQVLADIRTGTAMASAFDGLAARTGVASIARFAEGLAIAVERGTPLVEVLHAQAADVRESGRRELMEVGGRKEVAMMIPVVFLILPVTVVFAFFPGYIGLHLTSGM